MKEIILNHIKRYPQIQLQDIFKIIYQSEFGPGHLIMNKEENFKRLLNELENLPENSSSEFSESIGSGFYRLNLSVLKHTDLTPETFQKFFELSAKIPHGTPSGYIKKIEDLKSLSIDKEIEFSYPDISDIFNASIGEKTITAFSHSEIYRESYHPAYRVVLEQYIKYLDVFIHVDRLLAEKENIVIAIDGDAAAGKTTLANLIHQVYECPVISTDDFFLHPHQRTEERMKTPGYNMDSERFYQEVLSNLKQGKEISYQPFDCKTLSLLSPKKIPPHRITVVEGSYSLKDEFSDIYDLSIFLTIPEHLQAERILSRNGEELYQKFKNEWIPLEKEYQQHFNIQNKADLVF